MFTRRCPTPAEREILGELVRKARTTSNLTQQQLAEILDCSCHWISDIERGKCNPTWCDALCIAAVINMQPRDFAEKLKQKMEEATQE